MCLNPCCVVSRDISGTKCDFTVQVQLRYGFILPVLYVVVFKNISGIYFPACHALLYGQESHPVVFLRKTCCWQL